MSELSRFTHIVVGGGSAGCVMAARLSERPDFRVLLIEAGADLPPDSNPADILERYGGRAFGNLSYFWPTLRASRGTNVNIPQAAQEYAFYHQARVLGGGSSINAQIALRGTPGDYASWVKSGADAWAWKDVLPFFKKLENDLDYTNELHGQDGPIPIKRVPPSDWDFFTRAVTQLWTAQGYAHLADMNGEFGDGFASVPFSNDGTTRWSSARGYLSSAVRSRPNLQIVSMAEVHRVIFVQGNAVGVEGVRGGEKATWYGDQIILTAGALHTPKLLMLSGVGPGAELQSHGIRVVADREGVGNNLQDHPSVYVSAYLPPTTRNSGTYRGPATYLRYSSGIDNCPPSDMIMIATGRSGWHDIGSQLGTVLPFIGIPFSRGCVKLASPDPTQSPDVCFNYLDDERDRVRMVDGFRRAAAALLSDGVAKVCDTPFPTRYSPRVTKLAVPTRTNAALTKCLAVALDTSKPVRTFLINNVLTETPKLAYLLANEHALSEYVCGSVSTIWHPAGTCRMGRFDDSLAVTDGTGKVFGVENLYVADASVMPNVPSTNTNLPTMMVAERVAYGLTSVALSSGISLWDEARCRLSSL
ncbi:GMC family oxidoreductase [Paraburkholderia caribensis]|uniref:GMC family oxidoreductase n=1 Tax=Paraburkholderia caribensis TaxID=75105 RepID=UPI001CAD5AFD|nr:GMC oxidoreductase [Paraburkholderia caribensis]CAG9243749.1 putative 5-(hydroxymethyl)furfural oxidase [Paraburkholderia caribensis]